MSQTAPSRADVLDTIREIGEYLISGHLIQFTGRSSDPRYELEDLGQELIGLANALDQMEVGK